MTVYKDKTLMITGGTGSFGSTVLKHFQISDIGEILEGREKARRHAPRLAGAES